MLVAQLVPTRPHGAAAPHRKAPATPSASRDAPADDTAALDLALLARQQTFDSTVKQNSENEREMNVLRDMAMAQLKKDDENTKKWIAMI